MSTATIYFRESGDFEYSHVGFFGITEFEKGTWTKNNDTLYIDYNRKVPKFVGDKMILTEDEFLKITDGLIEESKYWFYRGHCKGLN